MHPVIATLLVALLVQTAGIPVSGNTIYAELKTELSSKRSKPGHRVEFTVLEAVRLSDAAVVIPVGARLTGNVEMVHRRNGEAPALISVIITRAEWKTASVSLNARISKLDLMGMQRRERPSMPYLRTAGPVAVPSASANYDDYYSIVPEDCGVEYVGDRTTTTAVVCHKREAVLQRGARVHLTDDRPAPNR